MHFWSKFGKPHFIWYWLIARTNSQAQNGVNFDFLSSIWPWRSKSMNPKNNRDLNQGVLHFWSKFGDCSLSGWQVIVRTNWWLKDTHTQTDAGDDNTHGHNWPRVKNGIQFQTIPSSNTKNGDLKYYRSIYIAVLLAVQVCDVKGFPCKRPVCECDNYLNFVFVCANEYNILAYRSTKLKSKSDLIFTVPYTLSSYL